MYAGVNSVELLHLGVMSHDFLSFFLFLSFLQPGFFFILTTMNLECCEKWVSGHW